MSEKENYPDEITKILVRQLKVLRKIEKNTRVP